MKNISNVTVSINGNPVSFEACGSPEFAAAMPKPVRDTGYFNLGKTAIELSAVLTGGRSSWIELVRMIRGVRMMKSKSKQGRVIAVYPSSKNLNKGA